MTRPKQKLIDIYVKYCEKKWGKEMENICETLEQFVAGCSFCQVTTIDGEGWPVTRALLPPRKRNGVHEFWFSTNTSSQKVAELRQNNKASVYFCAPKAFRGLLLKGTFEVLTDAASKRALWQNGDTMYYPGGVDDPDYCVLCFTATAGRYYSNLRSRDVALR